MSELEPDYIERIKSAGFLWGATQEEGPTGRVRAITYPEIVEEIRGNAELRSIFDQAALAGHRATREGYLTADAISPTTRAGAARQTLFGNKLY